MIELSEEIINLYKNAFHTREKHRWWYDYWSLQWYHGTRRRLIWKRLDESTVAWKLKGDCFAFCFCSIQYFFSPACVWINAERSIMDMDMCAKWSPREREKHFNDCRWSLHSHGFCLHFFRRRMNFIYEVTQIFRIKFLINKNCFRFYGW